MPHSRKRAILPLIEKRLKLFPVVGLLGARQTGKSTTLREQLSQLRKIKYISLDRDEELRLAQSQPTLFLTQAEKPGVKTVCIDEAQKAPVLFDTIKAEVDEMKRPGRFMLSGSSEFSKKTGVKESLTGRISLLRLFPLSLGEIHGKEEFLLKEVKAWADRGGMPGIFAIRDESARVSIFEEWVEATCSRDIASFGIRQFNPDLARRIFVSIATLSVPTRLEIARNVGKTPRQIEAYLQAFKALFAVYEIEPHPTSVGKSLFYIFDSGIAKALGASSLRCLQIWFLNECFSHFSYQAKPRPDVFHYETTRGSRIDFIVHAREGSFAYKVYEKESLSSYDLRALTAFREKHKGIPITALASCLAVHKIEKGVSVLPWGELRF